MDKEVKENLSWLIQLLIKKDREIQIAIDTVYEMFNKRKEKTNAINERF